MDDNMDETENSSNASEIIFTDPISIEYEHHLEAALDKLGTVEGQLEFVDKTGIDLQGLGSIQATDLVALINATPQLEDLHLFRVRVVGELHPLVTEAVLARSKTLKSICWFFYSSPLQQHPPEHAFPFAEALSRLPLLEKMIICSEDPMACKVASPALGRRNNTLKKVSLGSKLEWVGPMTSICLESSDATKKKDLCQFLDLCRGSRHLTELYMEKHVCLGSAQLKAACQLLRETFSLQEIGIAVDKGFDLAALLDCLKTNRTVRDLYVTGPGHLATDTIGASHVAEANSLLGALREGNCVLEQAQIRPWKKHETPTVPDPDALETGVNFFLGLNKTGRGELIGRQASLSKWMDKIAFHRDDLSAVFYYLQENVSMIIDPARIEAGAKRKRKAEALAMARTMIANLDTIANTLDESPEAGDTEECVALAASMRRTLAKLAQRE